MIQKGLDLEFLFDLVASSGSLKSSGPEQLRRPLVKYEVCDVDNRMNL
jgi:hypothetical protein